MTIVIAKRLQPDQQDVKLPATITFTATFRDDDAPADPKMAALELRLADGNDLVFSSSGGKSQPFPRKVPAADKEFSFTATIKGDAADLVSFRVALVFPDGQESGCLVRLA